MAASGVTRDRAFVFKSTTQRSESSMALICFTSSRSPSGENSTGNQVPASSVSRRAVLGLATSAR